MAGRSILKGCAVAQSEAFFHVQICISKGSETETDFFVIDGDQRKVGFVLLTPEKLVFECMRDISLFCFVQ